MIGSAPFPISLAELTADTLSVALDQPVTSFDAQQIGADRGMLGEIFLVTPTYGPRTPGAEASRPASVICKFAALRNEALASAKRGGTHEREVRCYDELLATSSASTPHFYAAWYDPDTAHFLLVQEAIGADGSVDQVAGIDPTLAALVGHEAARFHHERWADSALSELGWLPRLDDPRRIQNLTTLAANGWGPLCDLLGDELSPAEQGLGAELPNRLEHALRSLAELPSTLIHSDLRADNLLFAPDRSSVSLIDWQGAGIGPASFDLAYLLSHSLTVEARRSHADTLIADYLQNLSNAGTQLSHDEFMTGFKLSLHYGLAIACAMPLIADSSQVRVKALATAMARRSIDALADYELIW